MVGLNLEIVFAIENPLIHSKYRGHGGVMGGSLIGQGKPKGNRKNDST